jgi:hypothetical protein
MRVYPYARSAITSSVPSLAPQQSLAERIFFLALHRLLPGPASCHALDAGPHHLRELPWSGYT